jgi:hypothetical protein
MNTRKLYLTTVLVFIKVKVSRYTPWRRMGERRYSSYSYLTSATRWGVSSVYRSSKYRDYYGLEM